MEEIKDVQKKYCSQAMICAIVIALVSILIGQKSLGKGFILGTFFSIVNFIIMSQLMLMKIEQSRAKASIFALFSISLRLVILAVPLVVSLKSDSLDFVGVVIGLFMVQLTMIFHHLILNRLPFLRKS
jgi:hypothetical protein